MSQSKSSLKLRSELKAALKATESLLQDFNQAKLKALQASKRIRKKSDQLTTILVVDDDESFCNGMKDLAPKFDMEVDTLQPQKADDLIRHLRQSYSQGIRYKLLVLDHQLQGDDLTSIDLLKQLNATEDPSIRYLPRMVITQNAPEDVNDSINLANELLSLGADAIHYDKGHGNINTSDNNNLAIQTNWGGILHKIQAGELQEVRARSWGRMWRDVRNQLEMAIHEQKNALCTNTKELHACLSEAWKVVALRLTNSGYVKRANFRVFDEGMLHSIEPTVAELKETQTLDIRWDEMPYYKEWLIKALEMPVNARMAVERYSEFCKNRITSKDIGNPKLEPILLYHHAMGMPLFTEHGPIGMFTLVREMKATPWGVTDWEQMLTVGLRLAQFAQDLLRRQQNHQRIQALNDMVALFDRQASEADCMREAVQVLQKTLFDRILGLQGKASMPPPKGIDPGGRVTLRYQAPDHSLPGWGYGFGNGIQENGRLEALEAERDLLVRNVLKTGIEEFNPNTEAMASQYKPLDGRNKCLMMMPVIVHGVCTAVLAVGHTEVAYFGLHKDQSPDFLFLRQVAQQLGYQLEQKRIAHQARGALSLLLNLTDNAPQNSPPNLQRKLQEDIWVKQVLNLISHITVGCAAAIWLKPGIKKGDEPYWTVSTVWRQRLGPNELWDWATVPATERKKWQKELDKEWAHTLVSHTVSQSLPLVRFTNQPGEFSKDDELGVPTQSQLNLRIALNDSEISSGLIAILFTVQQPFVPEKLQDYLEDLSRLTALFILDRARLQELRHWHTIADERKEMADQYQQLRHELRTLLGSWANKVSQAFEHIRIHDPNSLAMRELKRLKQDLNDSTILIRDGMERIGFLSQSNPKTWIDLFDILKPVCEAIQTAGMNSRITGLTVHLDIPKGVKLKADESAFTTAVFSLLDNAVVELDLQFRGRAGRTKRTSEQGPACISIEWVPSKTNCELRVTDNGPGVHPAVLPKLFQPNITNRPEGSGFQLNHIQELLLKMGWTIHHEAVKPHGASFVISIPSIDVVYGSEETKKGV